MNFEKKIWLALGVGLLCISGYQLFVSDFGTTYNLHALFWIGCGFNLIAMVLVLKLTEHYRWVYPIYAAGLFFDLYRITYYKSTIVFKFPKMGVESFAIQEVGFWVLLIAVLVVIGLKVRSESLAAKEQEELQ